MEIEMDDKAPSENTQPVYETGQGLLKSMSDISDLSKVITPDAISDAFRVLLNFSDMKFDTEEQGKLKDIETAIKSAVVSMEVEKSKEKNSVPPPADKPSHEE